MVTLQFEGENLEAKRIHESVGACIYCSQSHQEAGGLGTEHIFPKGLGGKHEIPKASCRACEKITGSLEQKLLRGPLWPVRVRLGIHSGRRPGEQPTDFDVEFWSEEERKVLRLPIADIPVHITLPVLKPPALLTGEDWSRDGSFNQFQIISFDGGFIFEDLETAIKNADADKLSLNPIIHPVSWMRFVAKVLHGYATATLKHGFKPYLRDVILGKQDDLAAFYVGSIGDALDFGGNLTSRSLVAISLLEKDGKTLVIGYLGLLLPYIETPFFAVVGEINR